MFGPSLSRVETLSFCLPASVVLSCRELGSEAVAVLNRFVWRFESGRARKQARTVDVALHALVTSSAGRLRCV